MNNKLTPSCKCFEVPYIVTHSEINFWRAQGCGWEVKALDSHCDWENSYQVWNNCAFSVTWVILGLDQDEYESNGSGWLSCCKLHFGMPATLVWLDVRTLRKFCATTWPKINSCTGRVARGWPEVKATIVDQRETTPSMFFVGFTRIQFSHYADITVVEIDTRFLVSILLFDIFIFLFNFFNVIRIRFIHAKGTWSRKMFTCILSVHSLVWHLDRTEQSSSASGLRIRAAYHSTACM